MKISRVSGFFFAFAPFVAVWITIQNQSMIAGILAAIAVISPVALMPLRVDESDPVSVRKKYREMRQSLNERSNGS